MPHINNKSDANLQAAERLIASDLYAPSVHCSYYGCFQKMKVIVHECLKVPYSNIPPQPATFNKISEHAFVREQIINDIERGKRLSTYELQKLDKSVKQLYSLRITSDYKNECIHKDTADSAISLSKEIIKTLKVIYKV